jgi:formate hydrogenlyase subunit 4
MIEIILFVLLVPLALAFEGIRRKIVARMHNRQGPPLAQPFYDIFKLFSKKPLTKDNVVFNLAPPLALVGALVILLFIPYSILGFDFDFLVVGYIFILIDTIYIFGAVSGRSPFAVYASVRELLLMLGYEITFLIVMSLFFYSSGASGFADFEAESMFLRMPFASIFLLFAGLVILRVTPYDVMNADPEISAGFFSEYNGWQLAILKMAEWIKDFVVYMLLGFLLFGKAYALLFAPVFLLFYAVMLTSSPRYSTAATVRTFLALAALSFINIFLLV